MMLYVNTFFFLPIFSYILYNNNYLFLYDIYNHFFILLVFPPFSFCRFTIFFSLPVKSLHKNTPAVLHPAAAAGVFSCFRIQTIFNISGILHHYLFYRIRSTFTGITALLQINVDFSPCNNLKRIRNLRVKPTHCFDEQTVAFTFQCVNLHHKAIKLL